MPLRMINDLAPVDTLSDAPGAAEEQNERVAEAQALNDPGEWSAPETPQEAKARFRMKVENLRAMIAADVAAAKDAMWVARDGINKNQGLFARVQREIFKYRNELMPPLDNQGRVIEGGMDSHLKAGTSLGLFSDNVNTVGPAIADATLGRGRRAYELEPKGTKSENAAKKAICEDMIDSQFENANWRGEIISGCRDLPKHGTMILRQCWVESFQWQRLDDQSWEEVCVSRGLWIKHWPLLDLFVSNPSKKYDWEQDTVVWVSRRTLGSLTANERVWVTTTKTEPDPATGQMVSKEDVFARGKFVGLEELRRAQADTLGQYTEQGIVRGSTEQRGTSSDIEGVGEVAPEVIYDVSELQGRFPMGKYIRQGWLTPDMFDEFGINLNIGKDNPTNEELARIADSVYWYVTIIENGGLSSPMAIEIQPCGYRKPRNEVLHATFFPDGQNYYGLSSDAMASDLGDGADKILNDVLEIVDTNANPTAVGNSRLLDGEKDDIQKALRAKNEYIEFAEGAEGASASDVLSYLFKNYDASFFEVMNSMREMYYLRTLSNSILQGGEAQTETDTLGEAQIQTQGIERRLADVVRRLAEITVVRRSVQLLLEDMDYFLTSQGLVEEAMRVSGKPALDAKSIFPTAAEEGPGKRRRTLDEEFIIKAVASSEIDKAVTMQLMDSEMQLHAGDQAFNMKQMSIDKWALAGKDGTRYWIDDTGPMSPTDMTQMIVAGDRPQLDPKFDANGFPLMDMTTVYLPAFNATLMAWQQARTLDEAAGNPTDAWDGWLSVLGDVIIDGLKLQQQQMQMMAQMAQVQAQQAAASPAGKQGGKAKNPPSGDKGARRGMENKVKGHSAPKGAKP